MKELMVDEGIQCVDLRRLCLESPRAKQVLKAGCEKCAEHQWIVRMIKNFGQAGSFAGECRVGASKVGLAASLRRAAAFLLSGMKPGTERRGVVPESIVPRRSGLFQGAIHRARTGWLRLWRGCWVVSWDEGIGKTRVFWSWGASD